MIQAWVGAGEIVPMTPGVEQSVEVAPLHRLPQPGLEPQGPGIRGAGALEQSEVMDRAPGANDQHPLPGQGRDGLAQPRRRPDPGSVP